MTVVGLVPSSLTTFLLTGAVDMRGETCCNI